MVHGLKKVENTGLKRWSAGAKMQNSASESTSCQAGWHRRCCDGESQLNGVSALKAMDHDCSAGNLGCDIFSFMKEQHIQAEQSKNASEVTNQQITWSQPAKPCSGNLGCLIAPGCPLFTYQCVTRPRPILTYSFHMCFSARVCRSGSPNFFVWGPHKVLHNNSRAGLFSNNKSNKKRSNKSNKKRRSNKKRQINVRWNKHKNNNKKQWGKACLCTGGGVSNYRGR